MRLQLWYLNEDLAPLSLFIDDIWNEVQDTVNALYREPNPEASCSKQDSQFRNLSVADLVTQRSLHLFESLHMPQARLPLRTN